jgi:hypothetical protein
MSGDESFSRGPGLKHVAGFGSRAVIGDQNFGGRNGLSFDGAQHAGQVIRLVSGIDD